MRISRLLLAIELATVLAMIWFDWKFPIPIFWSPYAKPNQGVQKMYAFKTAVEVILSFVLLSAFIIAMRTKRSGLFEKCSSCSILGIAVGFWLRWDVFYRLFH